MVAPLLPDGVSLTVYSVVWPATEALVRRCLTLEVEAMLERHRDAFTKHQDALHAPFFSAWRAFVAPAVKGLEAFTEEYPCAGSSEAIREIIRQASWKQQALVIFDGDYEGYEAIAQAQQTPVIRVDRQRWRETLALWREQGLPWGEQGAQWWVSQPSAIDGNAWTDFSAWLLEVDTLAGCEAWVDLTYVGRARLDTAVDLTAHPCVAGVVFSLSKVMGAYYRRIGGCLSRSEVPGLWANRWFKNLDSLFLGQQWLEQAGDALSEGLRHRDLQAQAMNRALAAMGGQHAWEQAGVRWQASDVALLMHADPTGSAPVAHQELWDACKRGQHKNASARLCLTPAIETLLKETNHVA